MKAFTINLLYYNVFVNLFSALLFVVFPIVAQREINNEDRGLIRAYSYILNLILSAAHFTLIACLWLICVVLYVETDFQTMPMK